MFSPRIKSGVFVLEGLNAYGTTVYFTYLYFFMRDRFGFSNLENLALAALNGAVYAVWVVFAGRYAQRRGYFRALGWGFAILAAGMGAGAFVPTVAGQVLVLLVWTFGLALTWPALEAITSEQEPPHRLQRLLGIYNLVWSGGSGLATFSGGLVLEHLGARGIFLLPAALHVLQLGLLARLVRLHSRRRGGAPPASPSAPVTSRPEPGAVSRRVFLRLAWIANPLAYVAVNAIIPVIPELARRFDLSPAWAGVFCSVWALARAGGFAVFWLWSGWHYRFRWLAGAYAAMTVCFAWILLGQHLAGLVLAQAVFGLCLALIYYSSLFYSMDVGETKGEHGGLHEAAIGAGFFGGPALGAVSLFFLPGVNSAHAWAVSAVLLLGLGGLGVVRARGARALSRAGAGPRGKAAGRGG